MQNDYKSCKLCDYVGEDTHLHHIIPRSLGGNEDNYNLIELCVPCHNKAHNSNFGGEKGVIKQGIDKHRGRFNEAKKWLEANNEVLTQFIMDFYQETGSSILTDLLCYGIIKADDLHTWVRFGRGIRSRSFGDIPRLVYNFLNVNKGVYNINLEDDFSRF